MVYNGGVKSAADDSIPHYTFCTYPRELVYKVSSESDLVVWRESARSLSDFLPAAGKIVA